MSKSILEVKNLCKNYPVKSGILNRVTNLVRAVNNVSFSLKKGETLGLVGESGCGKSTLGRCLMRLTEPTSGEVLLNGENILEYNHKQMQKIRKKMQIIFQDPYASLNPRMTVYNILSEPMDLHKEHMDKIDRKKRLYELLDQVQLPVDTLNKYPHEFSGGQRQRICIARALAVNPEIIICDEPVSALDVSVQAQVVNILMDLQKDLGLSYIFIAHDLKVVEYISTEVAVMYLGKVVEKASPKELYGHSHHPYTKALFSAMPHLNTDSTKHRIILNGDLPSPLSPPNGCHFHPRCWKSNEECLMRYPESKKLSETHSFSCFHPISE
ncbi:MAG: dipeptide ABC transporter ATP-binding protein [Halobacteriovoraceae bacterium]|nr:dipeptide ABC transporter ATP-binding protein [Halobacteriovoraceae bacterium]